MSVKKKEPRKHSPRLSEYFTTREVAKICDVSIFSVQRWFDAGLLKGSTLPGGWRRVDFASLDEFCKKHNIRRTDQQTK